MLKSIALSVAMLALVAGPSSQAVELPDFTPLVDRNGPAVVNIQARQGNDDDPDPSDADGGPGEEEVPEIFRRFFGPGGPGGAPGVPRGPQRGRVSFGSGFLISNDGYILTNNHVVDGADSVTVRLSDRRELDATIVGSDAQYDIALLKVTAADLPAVTIGDSKKLKPGQWVVAIGSPFGFDHSVTAGIVSAVSRSFGGRDQQYVPFIQTDVAINRGNSGGPLFNLDGQVVGINSQIFSNTGGFMGVSFAIPIDTAMSAVKQIKEKGFVSRGMIGVQIQDVNRELAQSLGLPRTGGALVNSVNAGSASDKAGIKVGDVILSFGGVDVVRSSDLPPMVGATIPGTKVDVGVFRDGKTVTIPVTVAELPRDASSRSAAAAADGAATNPLGMVVEDLTAEQRQQLGLKDEGVVVTRITGVAARRAQLQPGDIILMVGKVKVKSSAEFSAAVKSVQPGDSVMLLVRREDASQFIAVTVPKKTS
ncbi:Do family serine endopeptidase [Tahibacter amnicola]|nr:Do family serine endopeptidase [Tahibacter amnicola]